MTIINENLRIEVVKFNKGICFPKDMLIGIFELPNEEKELNDKFHSCVMTTKENKVYIFSHKKRRFWLISERRYIQCVDPWKNEEGVVHRHIYETKKLKEPVLIFDENTFVTDGILTFRLKISEEYKQYQIRKQLNFKHFLGCLNVDTEEKIKEQENKGFSLLRLIKNAHEENEQKTYNHVYQYGVSYHKNGIIDYSKLITLYTK
jgi:hypothetical protein